MAEMTPDRSAPTLAAARGLAESFAASTESKTMDIWQHVGQSAPKRISPTGRLLLIDPAGAPPKAGWRRVETVAADGTVTEHG